MPHSSPAPAARAATVGVRPDRERLSPRLRVRRFVPRKFRRRGRLRIAAVATSAAVLAAALFWQCWLRDRLVVTRFGVVVPGKVYRSGSISRHLIEPLVRSHKIGTLIDLTSFFRHDADQLVEEAVAEYWEVNYHRIGMNGTGTGINHSEKYAEAVALIADSERRNRPVLVHCGAGTYRTGGVIATYRLLICGESPDRVLAELCRYGVDPADESGAALIAFLNQNMGRIAEALMARGILEQVPDPVPQLVP